VSILAAAVFQLWWQSSGEVDIVPWSADQRRLLLMPWFLQSLNCDEERGRIEVVVKRATVSCHWTPDKCATAIKSLQAFDIISAEADDAERREKSLSADQRSLLKPWMWMKPLLTCSR
jgi:hypothetical protein